MHALLDRVDAARDELVALTRDLVRFETVNTGAMPTGGGGRRWIGARGVERSGGR